MSEDKFEFGEEFELDKLRTEINMKKVIEGMNKNFKKAVSIKNLKGGDLW